MLAVSNWAASASDLYRQGRKYEKAGNIIQAYTLYAQASALDPKNRTYTARTAALQEKAVSLQLQNQAVAAAQAAVAKAAAVTNAFDEDDLIPLPVDDQADIVPVTNLELDKARRALPPPEVKLTSGHFDFHINAQPQELFNQVAQRCGLQTAFDSEFAQVSTQKVRFDIEDVDCRAALHAAEAATSSFLTPLSSKLV